MGVLMAIYFILRHFIGFALQMTPATLLLLLPFDPVCFRLPAKRQWLAFIGVSLGLSAIYSGLAYATYTVNPDAGFLFGNAFMIAGIAVVVAMFFRLINERAMRKLFVVFMVIAFAAVQYSLANALLANMPRQLAVQDGQSYDNNTFLAYLIVTAALIGPVALFFRRPLRVYIRSIQPTGSRGEIMLLIVLTAIYLALNALFTMFWARFHLSADINQSYYIPVILLQTAMLLIVYYSVIRLSNQHSEESERQLETAIIRSDHERIQKDMEKQREHLHDMRQLLRVMSVIAKNGSREDMQNYIDESVEHIHITDKRFCADRQLNGILQYYASMAANQGIDFSVQAMCGDLSFISGIDLTVMLGNVLENAIRAAREWRTQHSQEPASIRFTADDRKSLLRIQVENSCENVVCAAPAPADGGDGFLPAEAFQSTSGSGEGLRRVATIAKKYEGVASFRYDENARRFITRITLVMS